jgi:FkbH-like protein
MFRNLTVDDQIRLFAESLSRQDISPEPSTEIRNVKINVVRNEALEPTLILIDRFLLNFGIKAQWNIGPYDDTFQLLDFVEVDADATIVWTDWRRIDPEKIDYYSDRIRFISSATSGKPIIVLADLPGDVEQEFSIKQKITNSGSLHIEDFDGDKKVAKWRDPRLKLRNGTDLSNQGSMAIARKLGLQRIPELFLPIIKCIVVDLDNTLYRGTLGEDGIQNIILEKEHYEIARHLKRMKSQGVFLTVSSKNQDSDFTELLNSRADFPFLETDFSTRRISWAAKSQSIREIASELHIGLGSIAFIDDNPAEVREVSVDIPEVQVIFAQNPSMLLRQISIGPRFSEALIDTTKGIRELDAKSNKVREELRRSSQDSAELHRELDTKIRIQTGIEVDIERVVDMFARTNQFNLALKRSEINKVHQRLESFHGFVVTASVSDRFADSGVIAGMIGEFSSDGEMFVNEFVISCRALGRGLETPLADLMVSEIERKTEKEVIFISFDWEIGPRNEPAVSWINQFQLDFDANVTSGVATVARNLIKKQNGLQQHVIRDSE